MRGNRRWLALVAFGVLAVTMGACGGFQLRGSDTATATPKVTREPTAAATVRAVEVSPTSAPTATPTAAATATPAQGILAPGKGGRITAVVNVRAEARSAANRLGSLAAGDLVTIKGGPVNADNFSWYQVDNGKGLTGWVAAGPADGPWLVPAEVAAATPVAPSAGPRLVNRAPKKGDLIQVTTQNGLLLTVRDQPGKTGEPVAKAQSGDQFKIIDGPQDKDGLTWWQIEGAQYKGWAAEGDGETRWMTPVE